MSSPDSTIAGASSVSRAVPYSPAADTRCFNCHGAIRAGERAAWSPANEVVTCEACARAGFKVFVISEAAILAAAEPDSQPILVYRPGYPVLCGDCVLLRRDEDIPASWSWRGWFGDLVGRYESGGSASLFNVLGLGAGDGLNSSDVLGVR